jgi:anti-sigma factor RsiW
LPEVCERARAQTSLALDCELSELERAQLRAHLAECPDCAVFLAALRGVTHQLRAAPLPKPSRPLAPRRRSRRTALACASLAVLCAAGGGGLAGSLRSSHATPTAATAGPLPLTALVPTYGLSGARLPLRIPA